MKTKTTTPSQLIRRQEDGTHPEVSPLLSSYMIYVAEEGINLETFVLHGGHLARREKPAAIAQDLANLRGKIETLKRQHPRLGAQLKFLADVVADGATEMPATVRNEAIFALLYAAKDEDLIPDELPDIGFSDDAAVTEIVLSRYAEFFEEHCRERGMDWNALRAESQQCAGRPATLQ